MGPNENDHLSNSNAPKSIADLYEVVIPVFFLIILFQLSLNIKTTTTGIWSLNVNNNI